MLLIFLLVVVVTTATELTQLRKYFGNCSGDKIMQAAFNVSDSYSTEIGFPMAQYATFRELYGNLDAESTSINAFQEGIKSASALGGAIAAAIDLSVEVFPGTGKATQSVQAVATPESYQNVKAIVSALNPGIECFSPSVTSEMVTAAEEAESGLHHAVQMLQSIRNSALLTE